MMWSGSVSSIPAIRTCRCLFRDRSIKRAETGEKGTSTTRCPGRCRRCSRICATSGGVFRECYNVAAGSTRCIPSTCTAFFFPSLSLFLHLPWACCACRPESHHRRIVTALGILERNGRRWFWMPMQRKSTGTRACVPEHISKTEGAQ